MLPVEAVIEWKELYKKETGTEISIEEATTRANRMFRFLKTITKPSSSKNFKDLKGGVQNGKKTSRKEI